MWNKISCFFCILFNFNLVHAALVLNTTRLIYDEGKTEVSIKVTNSQNSPILVQSWVSGEVNAKKVNAFIVTPPIFRLEGLSSNQIRISKIKHLPDDRESLFWLNVKGIPPTEQNSDSKLSFAINTQIKLIYRPKSLTDSASIDSAYTKLIFNLKNDELVATNNTGYYVNLNEVKLGNKILHYKTIAPFSSAIWNVKDNNSKELSWSVLNDLGNVSKISHLSLQ